MADYLKQSLYVGLIAIAYFIICSAWSLALDRSVPLHRAKDTNDFVVFIEVCIFIALIAIGYHWIREIIGGIFERQTNVSEKFGVIIAAYSLFLFSHRMAHKIDYLKGKYLGETSPSDKIKI